MSLLEGALLFSARPARRRWSARTISWTGWRWRTAFRGVAGLLRVGGRACRQRGRPPSAGAVLPGGAVTRMVPTRSEMSLLKPASSLLHEHGEHADEPEERPGPGVAEQWQRAAAMFARRSRSRGLGSRHEPTRPSTSTTSPVVIRAQRTSSGRRDLKCDSAPAEIDHRSSARKATGREQKSNSPAGS